MQDRVVAPKLCCASAVDVRACVYADVEACPSKRSWDERRSEVRPAAIRQIGGERREREAREHKAGGRGGKGDSCHIESVNEASGREQRKYS